MDNTPRRQLGQCPLHAIWAVAIITRMEFVVTPEFVERYEALDDTKVECVDDAIRRLLADHRTAWARQNRVVGEGGSTWLIALSCSGENFALYWREATDESLILVLLLDK